ncbi:DnaJ subfamily C member 22 [Chionoecetes opilio]|uniref:DnaJ homolog subfamily C member 22 n=1 Tax=Chionoecetes opilio TaxID=41210 RepID=A0A8J8WDJ6_CHIOP|nr:DnaJ subfamily C member 22 [Chionoecetes opilio]
MHGYPPIDSDDRQEGRVEYLNPLGYVAGGDLDYRKRPRPRPMKKAIKSTWLAYLCWLVGGWCCLHLLYLRRDRQALVWYTTFFGYAGIGILRDFFRLPEYVRDVNESDHYLEQLMVKMRRYSKPPFSLVRFVGQILTGNSWSFLLGAAVPREPVLGVSLMPLIHLAPVGAALAVWNIGNIGRERGGLKWAVLGAVCVVPVSFLHPPVTNISALTSAILFNWRGKEWRRTPQPNAHVCKRVGGLAVCGLLFMGLWASHFYFNATVTDKNGEVIKLRDAAKNFLNSPMFLEFKRNFGVLYNNTREYGWKTAWMNFIELLDPRGEMHALKVLGLKKGTSQEAIKAAYKELAREWHPDKHREGKEEAHARFVEIQAAYERLSAIKNQRKLRNKLEEER